MNENLPSTLTDSLPSEVGSSLDFTSEARDINWIADDEDLYSEGVSESPLEKLRWILKSTQGSISQCEETVNQIADFDEDLNDKCETFAVVNLLPQNSSLAVAGYFKVIHSGVDILIKYGVNLLKPKKNPNWRSIKLSNAAFKKKVQPLKGYENVLKELGYTEQKEASFDFLSSLQHPDLDKVAVVTADLLILQRELNQFVNQTHVNRDRFVKYFSSYQIRDLPGGLSSTALEGIALERIPNQQNDPPKASDASKENLQVKTPIPAPRRNIPQVTSQDINEAKAYSQPQPSVKVDPTESSLTTEPLLGDDDIEILSSAVPIKFPPSRISGLGGHGTGEKPFAKPSAFLAWQDTSTNTSVGGELAGQKTTPHVPPGAPQRNPIKPGVNTSGLRIPADFTPYPDEGNSRSGKEQPEVAIKKPPLIDRRNKPQADFPLTQEQPQLSSDFPVSAASSGKEQPEVAIKKPPLIDRRNKPQAGFPLTQQQRLSSEFPVSAAGYGSPTSTTPPLPPRPGGATRSGSGTPVMNQESIQTVVGKSVGPPSNEYIPAPFQPQKRLPPGAQPTPFAFQHTSPVSSAAQPIQISGHVNSAAHVKQEAPSGIQQHGHKETSTPSGSQVTKRVVSHPQVPLELCAMCEGKPGIIHCDKCQSARCEPCDRRWHSHPKRKAHQTRRLVIEEPVVEEEEVKVEVEEKKDEECFVCGEIATFQCVTCPNFFCPGCEKKFHGQRGRQNHERFKVGVNKNAEQDAFLQDPLVTGAKPKTSSPVKAKLEVKKKPMLPPPTREEVLQSQHEEVVMKDVEVLEKIEIVAQKCAESLDRDLEQQLMQEEKLLRNQHLHLMDELAVIDEELANIRNRNEGEIQARGAGKRVNDIYQPPSPTMATTREDRPRTSQEGQFRDNMRQNTSQRQKRPAVIRRKWVCGHCTFMNENLDDRVCGVCSKTTPDPDMVEEQEADIECVDESDIDQRETPREREMYLQQKIQEEAYQEVPVDYQEEDNSEKQKEQENLSYRLLLFYKEALVNEYTLEDVKTAWDIMEREGGLTMNPREWLNLHLDAQLEIIENDIAKEFGRKYNVVINNQTPDMISMNEIHEAWWRNDGNRENTATECLELLYEKVEELHAGYCHLEKMNVAYALMESGFNMYQAKWKLEQQSSQEDAKKIEEWMDKMWEKTPDANIFEDIEKSKIGELEKKEKMRRILMAEHGIVWAAVDTVFNLKHECGHELIDCIEAVKAMGGNRDRAKDYFQECHICYITAPLHKMLTLPLCQCHLCTECVSVHFTVLAQTTSCMDRFVCPACNEPDLEHCTAEQYEAHFSLLSGMLKSCLAKKDYELYQQKLVNWGLIADENFRWCANGCGAGFINERVGVQKVQCPECKEYQCFDCMKPWLDQHDDSTCDEFDTWKKANDPEFQQQGLAAHLKENGINCPKCKMRYELAKGGCMHFKCPHCRHEFCCGCNLPFLRHPMCQKLPSCKGKGMHAHHPRDCFYYLRDEECKALQQLLMKYKVDFNQPTNVVAANNGTGPQVCTVKEQHEGPNGLEDAICGKPLKDQCGLCENHYKEYLVGLINQNNIDPVDILDAASLEAALKRNDKKIPDRVGNEADAAYCDRIRLEVQQQLPLRPRNAQGVQGVAAAANQI